MVSSIMRCYLCEKDIKPLTDYVTQYGIEGQDDGFGDWDKPEYAHFECILDYVTASYSLTEKGRRKYMK